MKKSRNIGNKLIPVAGLIGVIAIWELGVRLSNIEKWILPSPLLVIRSLWEARNLIWHHSVPTLLEAGLGLGSAVVVGVGVASIMEWSPKFKKMVYPMLVVSQTVPTIALAPLLVIWFGFGIAAKIIIIALVCFFPIAVNMTDGFGTTAADWIKVLRAMGARPYQIFRLAKLPSALPGFFSGLKVAGAYSILGAVIAEWFGAEKGLGILLMRSAKSYLTERVFATIFIITLFTLALIYLIEIIARLSIPWHYQKRINSH